MKKTLKGKIVSVKQQKTAIVEIVRKTQHPLYKKILTVSKKYSVDTEGFTPKVGDTVKITETRPMSKNKYFKITKLEAAK
jgi:small subunit ribosomal protein S17